MKRFLILLLLLLLCLTGCDSYAGKRPANYANTRWTCEDPEITLYVTDSGAMVSDIRDLAAAPGSVSVHFDYGSGFYVSEVNGGAELLTGKCSFSPETLRVKVQRDELFAGKYLGREICFFRSDWDGILPPGLIDPAESVSAETGTQSQTEAIPVPGQQAGRELWGTWINAGQYSEGRDFVETLTIEPEGRIRVHLAYQGKPFSDLDGVCSMNGDVLTFTMSDGTVRTYQYEVDGTVLTLTGEDRTVVYRRSD